MDALMCGGWTIYGQVLDVIQFDNSMERALLCAHKETKKLLSRLLCP
jgi:hypothetical protein